MALRGKMKMKTWIIIILIIWAYMIYTYPDMGIVQSVNSATFGRINEFLPFIKP